MHEMTGSLDFDMEAVSVVQDCKAGDMEVDISSENCELDSLNTNGLASPIENGKEQVDDITHGKTNGINQEKDDSNKPSQEESNIEKTNIEESSNSESNNGDHIEQSKMTIKLTQVNESDDDASDENESTNSENEGDENNVPEEEVNGKEFISEESIHNDSENMDGVADKASDDQEKEVDLKTYESETKEQSDKATSDNKDEDSPMEAVDASGTEEKEVSKPTNNIELMPDDSDDNSDAESEENSTEKSSNEKEDKKNDLKEIDNKEIASEEDTNSNDKTEKIMKEKEDETSSIEISESKDTVDEIQEEVATENTAKDKEADSSEADKGGTFKETTTTTITFNRIEQDSDDEDIVQEKDKDEVILEKEVEISTNQSEKRKADSDQVEPAKKPKLDELDKSLRKIRKMDRKDIENLLKKKLIEMFVYKEELGNLRRQCDKFKKSAESWKEQSEILSKNLKDLSTVQRKYMSESKEANGDRIVKPTKITRSVGLMVIPPEKRGKKKPIGPGGQNVARRLLPTAAGQQLSHQQKQTAQRPALQAAAPTATATQPRSATNGPQYINAAVAANKAMANRQAAMQQTKGVYRSVAQNGVVRPANKSAVVTNGLTVTSQPQRIQTQQQQSRPTVPSPRQPSNNPEVVDLSDDDTPVAIPTPQQVGRPGLTVRPVQTMRQIPQQRALLRHPAPLPNPARPLSYGNLKQLPPKPSLTIGRGAEGVVLKWNMDLDLFGHEPVISYQIFAYQELPNSIPDASSWKRVGDVKALPLPMACTLKQFSVGNKYHFSVRAMDSHKRVGPYSDPTSISV